MGNGTPQKSRVPFRRNADGSYSVTSSFVPAKITGTHLSGCVGRNPWNTPFSTACALLGLYSEDLSDLPAIKTGNVLERKILDYLRDAYGIVRADEIFDAREGDHSEWAQDFEDEIFGGHVDGITADGKIVEVKTAGNPEDWMNGVPEHYHLQASLYAHFLGASEILFAVGFVTDNDRKDPYKWEPEGNVSVITVPIIEEFDTMLSEARTFYDTFVRKGITPVPTDAKTDRKICEYLDAQLMDADEVYDCTVRYEELLDIIDSVKDAEKEAETLKAKLMAYMDATDTAEIVGSRSAFKRSQSVRRTLDTDAMKRDGVYDKYAADKVIYSFRKTKL